ncbi:predicted protein [Sclerotinia sclerotiorum 1980 UF-70]|uniref:Uncharacterized protein n=1 Tax=Sclerotinia sclerotiorum (strain ATCC 18683 / 1980 / Ss-1) TaxID=665079 RepID=A7F969_SCLS1|nr:predicted protein [Sclerotinia sclerotiorum 1980 UF-70]EDO00280.1 predicted protein [Sclerotinia sclerotiorum 1980 UF-70]
MPRYKHGTGGRCVQPASFNRQNPSIEVFKLALRRLENAIVDLSIEDHASDSPVHLNRLCNYCAVVGERLKIVHEDDEAAQEVDFGGDAKDVSGNLHLGRTLAQEGCYLCCLIKRKSLRDEEERNM